MPTSKARNGWNSSIKIAETRRNIIIFPSHNEECPYWNSGTKTGHRISVKNSPRPENSCVPWRSRMENPRFALVWYLIPWHIKQSNSQPMRTVKTSGSVARVAWQDMASGQVKSGQACTPMSSPFLGQLHTFIFLQAASRRSIAVPAAPGVQEELRQIQASAL